MHVIVAGCGRVGARLADYLSFERHNVVIIDRDPNAFSRLGALFNGITLEGTAFDEEILNMAGAHDADAFVATTDQENTNLMASEIARTIFTVPNVLSRLYDPGRERTYFKLNVDYICGTTLVTGRIHDRIFQREDSIVQYDRGDLGVQIVEFSAGREAEGKPAGNLNRGVSSRILILERGNRRIDFDETTSLSEGDRVVMILRREGWRAVSECLGPFGEDGAALRGMTIPGAPAGESEPGTQPQGARVIVGGCSLVGAHLAFILSMEGHKVTIIDEEPNRFRRLAPGYSGDFYEGVIYDEETLLAAGIEEADAFIAVTKKDNKNLMAAEVTRHVFKVPHVIGRLFNPDLETTYQALGMPYVCGTTLLSQALLERLLNPILKARGSCVFNKYTLVEFDCPPSWDGRPVRTVVEDTGITFAYIIRRTTAHLPDDNFVLRRGDSLGALAYPKVISTLEKGLQKLKRG